MVASVKNRINDQLQANEIQGGFAKGRKVAWSTKSHEFKMVTRREAKALGEEWTTTLGTVSKEVVNFFEQHKGLSRDTTIQAIQARVKPYKGWRGWLLSKIGWKDAVRHVVKEFDALEKELGSKAPVLQGQPPIEEATGESISFPAPGDLNPLPQGGIRMGIPNVGNSCWFNSVLKFLASTTVYDKGFNQNNSELSKAFRLAINELRSGKGGQLNQDILFQVIVSVMSSFPEFHLGQQIDSDEFIRVLMGEIWPDAGGSYRSLKLAKDHGVEEIVSECTNIMNPGTDIERNRSEQFKGVLTLRVDDADVQSQKPISLDEVIRRFEKIEDQSRTRKLTHLPEHLVVNFQRASSAGTCRCPIQFNERGQIEFRRFNRENLSQDPEIVRYEVVAAIEHQGEDNRGHYICWTQSEDGTRRRHSDQMVSEVEKGPIGAQASVLYLRKVQEPL